jgi:flavin reductase (DIM6/NTAB) family NADH-FMN oxidoreductase RutF
MANENLPEKIVTINTNRPFWHRFFTVYPLVLVGSKEKNGDFNFAPKHLAMPLSWDNYYGFICTPRHTTYKNIQREGYFTVSFPRPSQILIASLAAGSRTEDDIKPSLKEIPTIKASEIDGVFVKDAYLFLECELDRILDGFGENSMITGKIVAAHIHDDSRRIMERDDHDLIKNSPLLVYLNEGRFAKISETYSFPFPVNFKK